MATGFKIATEVRNAMIEAGTDLVDGGSIVIYTGSPPSTVAEAASGTLLATLPLSNPAFGAASTGTVTADTITDDSDADDSGDAGYFRILTSGASPRFQGTAGESADTPDMVFDNKSIVAGGVVSISSLTITQPIGP